LEVTIVDAKQDSLEIPSRCACRSFPKPTHALIIQKPVVVDLIPTALQDSNAMEENVNVYVLQLSVDQMLLAMMEFALVFQDLMEILQIV